MVHEGCFPEWEQEIWFYLDTELPEEDRIRVERHLENCRRCREFLVDIRPVEDSIRSEFRVDGAQAFPKDFTKQVMGNLPTMIALPWSRQVWLLLRRNLTPQAIGTALSQHPVTVAALFALFVGSLVSIWLGQAQQDYRVKLVTSDGGASLVRLSESIVCHKPDGQMYELPDGTLVFAHSGAIFSIEAYRSNGDDRWISLKRGEIWLDVEREAREGFTVSTPEAYAKAVGTCFAIQVKPRETCVEVARGVVLVENAGRGHPRSCRLKAAEKITADRRGRLSEWGHVTRERVEQVLGLFQTARAEEEAESRSKSEPLFNLPGQ